ncbi:hypothetical protein EDD40_1841 [Saccharothrix texasensis]|uniref:Uncharacterized protein n=1 Tax=Saccharothrix texasensis TaxID=103734 RepID=A0A3N1H210_9PSEU|nr:hypothetical protein EDD40_1841 [Saccharothrix texasensis]
MPTPPVGGSPQRDGHPSPAPGPTGVRKPIAVRRIDRGTRACGALRRIVRRTVEEPLARAGSGRAAPGPARRAGGKRGDAGIGLRRMGNDLLKRPTGVRRSSVGRPRPDGVPLTSSTPPRFDEDIRQRLSCGGRHGYRAIRRPTVRREDTGVRSARPAYRKSHFGNAPYRRPPRGHVVDSPGLIPAGPGVGSLGKRIPDRTARRVYRRPRCSGDGVGPGAGQLQRRAHVDPQVLHRRGRLVLGPLRAWLVPGKARSPPGETLICAGYITVTVYLCYLSIMIARMDYPPQAGAPGGPTRRRATFTASSPTVSGRIRTGSRSMLVQWPERALVPLSGIRSAGCRVLGAPMISAEPSPG